ncbi:MAG: arsenite methyltransferase [archaeon]
MEPTKIKEFIKKWFSAVGSADCSSCSSCSVSSCPTAGSDEPPHYIAWKVGYTPDEIKTVPEEAVSGLGCGNPVALAKIQQGQTVLDLGSGGGMDAFLASKKVGSTGKVIGVDLTPEMVEKAKTVASKHGYDNVEFRLGDIESLPIDDNSVDVVISNCVINMVPDKVKAFKEAYRVLNPGGRLLVSDLVSLAPIPDYIKDSPNFWARCIGGALQKDEYLQTVAKAGFSDVKFVAQRPYVLNVPRAVKGKIISIQVEAQKRSYSV